MNPALGEHFRTRDVQATETAIAKIPDSLFSKAEGQCSAKRAVWVSVQLAARASTAAKAAKQPRIRLADLANEANDFRFCHVAQVPALQVQSITGFVTRSSVNAADN